eukprot:11290655-Prorocentrum_lima.AAC.1
MCGPKKNLQEGWKLICTSQKGTQALILDDPTGPDRYLGCKHILTTGPLCGKSPFLAMATQRTTLVNRSV